MKSARLATLLLASIAISLVSSAAPTALEAGFTQTPAQSQPWCYSYWVSDNFSKEGITKDLQAIKRIGIGWIWKSEEFSPI